MSLDVNDIVKFTEDFKLHGHVSSMEINIPAGRAGRIVDIDDNGDFDVEVFEGFVISNISPDILEKDDSPEAKELQISSMTKDFHKSHPAHGAKPGFNKWKEPEKPAE